MPISQMHKTQNQVFPNGSSGSATQKNSQYKFHSQKATLAHSRMTRRQISMSRQSSYIGGASNKHILHSSQAINFKHDSRYASQPPGMNTEPDPYCESKSGGNEAAVEKKRMSKTPVVPPINIKKLNSPDQGLVSVSPFHQTISGQGVNMLSAQMVTSKSNNAFIANNFYIPGRHSSLIQTKSSSHSNKDEQESPFNCSFEGE